MYIHVFTRMYFTHCSKLAQLFTCQLLILISQSFSRIFSFICDNFVCAYSVSYWYPQLSPPPLSGLLRTLSYHWHILFSFFWYNPQSLISDTVCIWVWGYPAGHEQPINDHTFKKKMVLSSSSQQSPIILSSWSLLAFWLEHQLCSCAGAMSCPGDIIT